MPEAFDLESVIEDSITDAVTETDTTPDPTDEPAVEAPSGASDEPSDKTITDSPSKADSNEVASPGAQKASDEEDEFAKKHGLPGQLPGGRENRIPYSRVKKIAANAEKVAVETAQKKWEAEKLTPLSTRIAELEPKIQDYEARLGGVAQFENVMANQPREFLQMLSKIPAYAEFFSLVDKAVQHLQNPQVGGTTVQPQVGDQMPQPDQTLSDGTQVYSMEGLQKLQDWQGRQIEARLSKTYEDKLKNSLADVEQRYAPIKQQFDQAAQLQAVIPQIQKQIDEARKWPAFTDNEEEITKALQADRNLSLEGAYRSIVLPKLAADRDRMRQSILEEIQKKPAHTSVQSRSGTKPVVQPANEGGKPGDLEDTITASLRNAGLL